MVLLRLSVNVYPPDQLPSSSSFSLRSILRDRNSENNSQSSSNSTTLKPAGILLLLHDPEAVTLGGLAAMTQEKWKKLRPNAGPLEIKKIVDDDNPSFDLDPDMTIADVWVDKGKARVDGHDQHATARVIQKPTPQAPVRFPSVEQDWNAAASSYQIQKHRKKDSVHKYPTIPEAASQKSLPESTLVDVRTDQPLRSVESDDPELRSYEDWFNPVGEPSSSDSDASSVSPDSTRMESQELGDIPVQRHPEKQQYHSKPVERKDDGSEYEIKYESASESESDVETGSVMAEGSYEIRHGRGEESNEHDIYETESDRSRHGSDGDDLMGVNVATASKSPIFATPKTGIDRLTRVNRASASVQLGKRKAKENGDLPASKGPRLDLSSTPASFGGSQRDIPMEPSTDISSGDENASDTNESGHDDDGPQRRGKIVNFRVPNNSLHSDEAARRRPLNFGGSISTNSPPRRPKSGNTAIEEGKLLPSALRSTSQSSQPTPRRYVSFADEQGLSLKTGAGTKPQPHAANDHPRANVSPQSASREGSPHTASVVYPPGVSAEMVQKIVREADEKLARQVEQTREYERRIEAAKNQNTNPEYVRQLGKVLQTWMEFLELERNFKRQKQLPAVRRLEYRHSQEVKVLQEMERLGKAAPSDAGRATNGPRSEKQIDRSRTREEAGSERIRTNNSEIRLGSVAEHSTGHAPNNDSPHTRPAPISAATRTPINKSHLQRGHNIRDRVAGQGGANRSPPGAASFNQSAPKPPPATSVSMAASRPQPAGQGAIGQKHVPEVIIESEERPSRSAIHTHSTGPANAEAQSARSASSSSSSDLENLPSVDKLIRTGIDHESPPKSRNAVETGAASQSDIVPSWSQPGYKPSWPNRRSSPASARRAERTSLKDLLDDQKSAKVAQTQQHGQPMSSSPQRKMGYVLQSERELSEDEESNGDSHSSSYSDNGDILSTGAVQKLRSPRRRGML